LQWVAKKPFKTLDAVSADRRTITQRLESPVDDWK
jgi:hypothetical protein